MFDAFIPTEAKSEEMAHGLGERFEIPKTRLKRDASGRPTHSAIASVDAIMARESAGPVTFRDDPSHMRKLFQAGVAARGGMTAALVAHAGSQGLPNFPAQRDGAILTTGLGERFAGATIRKRNPSGEARSLWWRPSETFSRRSDAARMPIQSAH